MKQHILSDQEILAGYDAACALYPHIPSLSMWRAWEYAAYQKFFMAGRILDLGCGDGQYFRLLWPAATDVTGIDMDEVVVVRARTSGVYREVHAVAAHSLPFPDASFDTIFANCSLEHMDRLDLVLAACNRCLKPGGSLLCSVVTNRFVEWSMLPAALSHLGYNDPARRIQAEFEDFHHLANPLTVEEWIKRFAAAGFSAEEHIPLLPKASSAVFLAFENVWHLKKRGGGELGDLLFQHFTSIEGFPTAFRHVLQGVLEMDSQPEDCSGAVFKLSKSR